MSDAPADHYRSQELMNRLSDIAKGVFARHSVDFSNAIRLGGWTNVTWLAGGLVLHLSTLQGSDKIHREVRLASLLPREVGFPQVIETEISNGYEWSLSQELPGKKLGEVWKDLSWAERASTLTQIWDKVEAVHKVDIDSVSGLAHHKPWFNATNAEGAKAGLSRLVLQKILTKSQASVLTAALEHYWQILPLAACVLNHGDLTVDNVLWHAGQVVSLLDFEFAVIAPGELDLYELVKWTFAPLGAVDLVPEPDRMGLAQLQRSVADLALPVLIHPGGRELLVGYAILLELRILEDWLAHPEGEGPLEQWQPYRILISLADGKGGYLNPIIS